MHHEPYAVQYGSRQPLDERSNGNVSCGAIAHRRCKQHRPDQCHTSRFLRPVKRMVEDRAREDLRQSDCEHQEKQQGRKGKPPSCDGGIHFFEAAECRGEGALQHPPILLRAEVEARLDSEIPIGITRNLQTRRTAGTARRTKNRIGLISQVTPHESNPEALVGVGERQR